MYDSLDTCPEELLLFFHNIPYTHKLKSNKTLIQHIYQTHIEGVVEAHAMLAAWMSLATDAGVDAEMHSGVAARMQQQVRDASSWRDNINGYFAKLSGVAPPPPPVVREL
jgi:alpha-glucuronidase